jgi:hypothetical protein
MDGSFFAFGFECAEHAEVDLDIGDVKNLRHGTL